MCKSIYGSVINLHYMIQGDLDDREVFRRLFVEGMKISKWSANRAAKEFKTAPGTISRWINGHSAPTRFARKPILDHIVQYMLTII